MEHFTQKHPCHDELMDYFEAGYRKGMHQLAAQMYDVMQLSWSVEQLIEFVGRCEDAANAFRYSDIDAAGVHFVIDYARSNKQDYSTRKIEDESEEDEIGALHEDDMDS